MKINLSPARLIPCMVLTTITVLLADIPSNLPNIKTYTDVCGNIFTLSNMNEAVLLVVDLNHSQACRMTVSNQIEGGYLAFRLIYGPVVTNNNAKTRCDNLLDCACESVAIYVDFGEHFTYRYCSHPHSKYSKVDYSLDNSLTFRVESKNIFYTGSFAVVIYPFIPVSSGGCNASQMKCDNKACISKHIACTNIDTYSVCEDACHDKTESSTKAREETNVDDEGVNGVYFLSVAVPVAIVLALCLVMLIICCMLKRTHQSSSLSKIFCPRQNTREAIDNADNIRETRVNSGNVNGSSPVWDDVLTGNLEHGRTVLDTGTPDNETYLNTTIGDSDRGVFTTGSAQTIQTGFNERHPVITSNIATGNNPDRHRSPTYSSVVNTTPTEDPPNYAEILSNPGAYSLSELYL